MEKGLDKDSIQPKIVSHQQLQFETKDKPGRGDNPSDGNNGWGNG